jgi:voltage-gated potassium channel Kch
MFDNYMSKGTLALIGGLAVLSLVVIVIAAAIISVGGTALAPEGSAAPMSFVEAAWESLMRTFDAGTMGGDAGWGFRMVMLFVTIGGIFVVSTLIGVLTAGVEGKLDELRKGRSRVLENDHTLILGWSPQIFTIISELVTANKNRKKGAVIVVLAEKDKVEMEDALRDRVPDTENTRVICRSGSPMDLNDLEIASPHTARAIIILPPEEGDPDAFVTKAVLAITNNPNRRAEPYHIVTQISAPQNMDVLRMIGQKDAVQAVLVGDLIARVTAQTSRQSGLSVVYTELLNFGGDEIYFREEPSLVGKTFGEALLAYEDSALMGLRRAAGATNINPPMDSRIEVGDKLFALSADDDTIRLSGLTPAIAAEAIQELGTTRKPRIEKALILGWNRCGATIIRELDNYVLKGSQLMVVANSDVEKEFKDCNRDLVNQKAQFSSGDTTARRTLDDLSVGDFDHVIVLSYEEKGVQEADSLTLVTLLHLRDIAEKQGRHVPIVSEMLDLRNRELAEVAHVDDFIVSDHLVSLMLSQLSENSDLYDVFADIFDPEGSEIYLKPVDNYVTLGRPLNFYTLVEAARRHGETAIGYRLAAEAGDAGKSYGVHTNPKKSELVSFSEGDKIIVLAEN